MSIIEIFSTPMILSMLVGAVAIGIMISVCASLLGVTLVLKKYSMLSDGLAHIGFGSMAIASLCETLLSKKLGGYAYLVSVPIVIAAAILIIKLGEGGGLRGDSAIAMVSTSALAIGYIVFQYATGNSADVCSSMFGSASILSATTSDFVVTGILAAAVIVIFILYYNRIFAITFDETYSKASGVKTERFKTVIAILAALTVVMGMKMLGAVMISGLVVFPALSAMRLFGTFKRVMFSSAVISCACTVVGILLAFMISGLPIGPAVVMVNLLVYLVITFIPKKSR